ncbi:MAG: NB-ARC domain-containing protein [Steroidobacteraceae bacterium]
MIVTFYSYKGGVGRSMALANVARWFQLRGLNVVMVDWDLEAPGLESFFIADAAARDRARGAVGLVDMLVAYKDLFRSLPKPDASDTVDAETEATGDPYEFVKVLDEALPALAHSLIPIRDDGADTPDAGKLWLLTAGCRSGERFDYYAEAVQQFNWAEFYSEYEGETYFEWLRRQLIDARLADIVLIDSRTGVAEMSGVCTRQLADVVVSLCAPNDQNLQGVDMMARSFKRPDLLAARGGREIDLLMVGSRLDLAEGRPVDLFQQRFDSLLGAYVPETLRDAGADFSKLRIPYVSAYAYSERLAVGDPEGVRALQDAYEAIAVHVALLAPPESLLRARCWSTLRQFFSLPAVFFVADGSAGPEQDEFQERLQRAGLFAEHVSLAKLTELQAPELVGPNANGAVVFALGSTAQKDRSAMQGLRYLRANGVPTYLVALGETLRTQRPAGFGNVSLLDPNRDFDELVQRLQKGGRVPRVPFLAPPTRSRLIGRDHDLSVIISTLIARGSSLRGAVIVGMGGIGKTAVARAVCDADEIYDHFDGGILWCSLGPQPNLYEAFAKWVIAFEGEGAVVSDLDEAERRLAHHLARRRCLVVLDDLLDWELLKRVPRSDRSVILVTSRLRVGTTDSSMVVFELGPLAVDDASRLLVEELPVQAAGVAEQIAARLGGSPLAIQQANQTLRAVTPSEVATDALDSLLADIDREGIMALGAEGQAVMNSFALATERLPPQDRSRLYLLATLPEEKSISIEAVRSAGIEDATEMLRRLSALSLVEFDGRAGTVVIPHLTHAFTRSLAAQQRRAEQSRVAVSGVGKAQIYISYRRDDSGTAGRLYDRLIEYFGPGSTFMDVASISIGQDIEAAVRENLDAAAVMLVIIGRSPIARAGEFTRREIGYALERDTMRVIPVVVDGATMPMPDELPPELVSLTRRSAIALRADTFNQDTDLLIRALDPIVRRKQMAQAAPAAPSARTTAAESAAIAPEARPKASVSRSKGRWIAMAASVMVAVGVALFFTMKRPDAGPQSTLAESQFSHAEDLYFGRGVNKDIAAAARLYAQAANAGFPPAQNALGRLYESGEGVAENDATALSWYQRAAAQGHPEALAAVKRLSSKPPPQMQQQWVASSGYGVVVSGQRSSADAQRDLKTAIALGYNAGLVYMRDGYRAVVGPFETNDQAKKAAQALSGSFSANNIYVRELSKWCASPQQSQDGGTPVAICAQ